jgi:hypothetical protein
MASRKVCSEKEGSLNWKVTATKCPIRE